MNDKKDNHHFGAKGLFLVVTGAMALIVDAYSFLQIINQIHLPSSFGISLPALPRIHFSTDTSVSIQTRDVTLVLLVYVILVYCILVGLYASRRKSGDNRAYDSQYLSRMLLGAHTFVFLIILWSLAFSQTPNLSTYVFLGKVWLLSTLLLLWFVVKQRANFILFGIIVLIPLWIFAEKSLRELTWLTSILSVLLILVSSVIYFVLLVFLSGVLRWISEMFTRLLSRTTPDSSVRPSYAMPARKRPGDKYSGEGYKW